MLNAEEVNKIKEDLKVVLDKEEEDDALEIMNRLDKELVYNKELLKYEEEKGKNQPKINNDNKSAVSSHTNNKSINNKKLLKRSHSEHESTGSPTDTTPSPTNSSSNTAEIKILKKARTAVTNLSSKNKDNVVTTNKIITKTTTTVVTKQTKRNISQSESSGSPVDSPTSTTDDTNFIKKARNNTIRSTPTKTSSTDTSPPLSTTANEERKFEIEIDSYEGSGDKTRNTCVGLLYNAMAFDSTASSEVLLSRSERIESIVLKQNNGNPAKEYRDKLRGLILNLKAKNNPKLRHGVVDGTITVERFCTMSKEEMASEEMRARDRAIQNNNHLKARGAAPPKSETNMFRCGKCGKRETTYYQMQIFVLTVIGIGVAILVDKLMVMIWNN
ncbi:5892_t:CDS:2 [Entrophospora sp. SA101]|nr:5892_t:CDS:2 [Entrophospora sp. SA101]